VQCEVQGISCVSQLAPPAFMQRTVYETVRFHLFICPSSRSQTAATCSGFAAVGRQVGDIDRLLH